jgi:hypothetical protein
MRVIVNGAWTMSMKPDVARHIEAMQAMSKFDRS